MLHKIMIYGEAALEMFLTQLNIFDIYTDFAFLTIVSKSPDLGIYFVMSLVSFTLTLLPKLYSFILILRIICSNNSKYRYLLLMGTRNNRNKNSV